MLATSKVTAEYTVMRASESSRSPPRARGMRSDNTTNNIDPAEKPATNGNKGGSQPIRMYDATVAMACGTMTKHDRDAAASGGVP